MEIPVSILVLGFTATAGLIGVVWGMLRSKIESGDKVLADKIENSFEETTKCEKVLHKRIDKVENGLNCKVSISGCDKTQRLVEAEIVHTKEMIESFASQQAKDHGALIKTLDILGKKQDATNETMGEMAVCLALLSEKIPCPSSGKREYGK